VHERRGARARTIAVETVERRVQFRERHGVIAPLASSMAARQERSSVSPSSTNSMAGRSVAVISCSTCAIRKARAARCPPGRRAGLQNRGEQAGLARTVGAGQADPVAAKNREVDLLDERLRTAPQGQIPSG